MAYTVVRTDNMTGTRVESQLASVRYMGADGSTPTELENGSVIKLGDLIDGEREVYIGTDMTGTEKINEVVLVVAPEVMYDERKSLLTQYINYAGKNCRGYYFNTNDRFSLTAEGFTGTPEKGAIVELAAGTKLNAVSSATGATVVGEIQDVETVGSLTYYMVKVTG